MVDTIGMNDKSILDYFGTPHTDALHVVERYRMADDGKSLDVVFMVDDPKTFNMPWAAMAHYRRTAQAAATESGYARKCRWTCSPNRCCPYRSRTKPTFETLSDSPRRIGLLSECGDEVVQRSA